MLHTNETTPKKLWLKYTNQNDLGIEYLSTNFSADGTLKSRFVCSLCIYSITSQMKFRGTMMLLSQEMIIMVFALLTMWILN